MDNSEPDSGTVLPALPDIAELAERQAAARAAGPSHLDRFEAIAPGLQKRQERVAMQALRENRSSRSRLGLALQIVDEFGQALRPLAACRRGCAHCCHIRVEMTELEAERLGAAVGRTPNRRQLYMLVEDDAYGYETPCPFLAEGECSIYEHRPFACRKHHSLDVDALFCRLDMPAEFASSVPRIQPYPALLVWGSAITASMGVADIRDWFPGPREFARGPVGRIASARQALKALEAQEAPCPKT